MIPDWSRSWIRAMDARSWKVIRRDYAAERKLLVQARVAAHEHPLLLLDAPTKLKVRDSERAKRSDSASAGAPDPLSMMLMGSASSDPLSDPGPPAAAAAPEVSPVTEQRETENAQNTSVPWSVKKQTILREYTTSGSIRVTATFMSDVTNNEGGEGEGCAARSGSVSETGIFCDSRARGVAQRTCTRSNRWIGRKHA